MTELSPFSAAANRLRRLCEDVRDQKFPEGAAGNDGLADLDTILGEALNFESRAVANNDALTLAETAAEARTYERNEARRQVEELQAALLDVNAQIATSKEVAERLAAKDLESIYKISGLENRAKELQGIADARTHEFEQLRALVETDMAEIFEHAANCDAAGSSQIFDETVENMIRQCGMPGVRKMAAGIEADLLACVADKPNPYDKYGEKAWGRFWPKIKKRFAELLIEANRETLEFFENGPKERDDAPQQAFSPDEGMYGKGPQVPAEFADIITKAARAARDANPDAAAFVAEFTTDDLRAGKVPTFRPLTAEQAQAERDAEKGLGLGSDIAGAFARMAAGHRLVEPVEGVSEKTTALFEMLAAADAVGAQMEAEAADVAADMDWANRTAWEKVIATRHPVIDRGEWEEGCLGWDDESYIVAEGSPASDSCTWQAHTPKGAVRGGFANVIAAAEWLDAGGFARDRCGEEPAPDNRPEWVQDVDAVEAARQAERDRLDAMTPEQLEQEREKNRRLADEEYAKEQAIEKSGVTPTAAEAEAMGDAWPVGRTKPMDAPKPITSVQEAKDLGLCKELRQTVAEVVTRKADRAPAEALEAVTKVIDCDPAPAAPTQFGAEVEACNSPECDQHQGGEPCGKCEHPPKLDDDGSDDE